MGLTYDDVNKILNIVDNAPHVDEIQFAYSGVHLHIHRGRASTGKPATQSSSVAKPLTGSLVEKPVRSYAEREQGLGGVELALRAPVAGIFRRSQTPDQRPFVEIGQRVEAEDTLCLVGAAHPNSIKAGAAGVVKQILAENGELVEFDQLLIIIVSDAGDLRP